MIYLRLAWEFFKTGLFSVGGGLATLPFLYAMSVSYTHLDVYKRQVLRMARVNCDDFCNTRIYETSALL